MSQFRQHYSRLHDDELIHLSLTRELTPEAQDALRAELQERGITDLSSHERTFHHEAQAEDQHREKQILFKQKIVRWRTWFIYLGAALACSRGAYLLLRPNLERPGDDGGLLITMGIAMFLFGWGTSFLSRIWSKHVIHRKPPL
jgi:hypothetical protein